jgi:predicted acyl esterase
MGEGTRRDEWVVMPDGVRLAVTLFLPAGGDRQPCLLEALPYRKDDMTCSYAADYVRLRDEYSYAVARLDLRGTGSSAGRACDEYPEQEQADLQVVIAWLAAQPWCDGNVGMYGTSYSGFNSLQLAAERPPALKAVVAIFATDDRFEDDVHYMGGSLRWLDLVDYCHYMTAMNALPPVPAVWGQGWREEWVARVAEHEPWLHTWLAHQRRDAYWQHGSVRPSYADIECAVLLVAGWADGYRNNTFRTVEALREAGTPVELLAGPWSHADPATALPGPRIDLVPEMVAWWDRWLRGSGAEPGGPNARWFVRQSHGPSPDLDTVPGTWRADGWPSSRSGRQVLPLTERPAYSVLPDVGLAAWNSCAGHLPWGQPDDQRYDDARSLRWDWPLEQGLEIAGYPLLRLKVQASGPVATVAARLCDVAADGTSTLVTRGLLNLTRRGGPSTAEPLEPGRTYDVELALEATAYRWSRERTLRLALAGADWPNTVAPPRPLQLTVLGGELVLPTYDATGSPHPEPVFASGAEGGEDPGSVIWETTRNVLSRVTSARVDHGSTYDADYGSVTEHYAGTVSVDTRSWHQEATADVTFTLRFADDGTGAPVECTARSTSVVTADETDFHVTTKLDCWEGGQQVASRCWQRSFPRDLA